jgi:hypothetical protein
MSVVESAYGVEGGALGQRTWHTWCPHLINRYNNRVQKPDNILIGATTAELGDLNRPTTSDFPRLVDVVLKANDVSRGTVPVDVDEVDGAAAALVEEGFQPAEAGGRCGGGVCAGGGTEIHDGSEVCEGLHVGLPADYGVRDGDA